MTADQHALALAAEEHQRTIMPLRKKAASLSSSSAAARAGIKETARTLRELETRLRLLEDHQRATAADIAAAEREYTTFTSRLGGQTGSQRPAPANPATLVAPAAQQPLAPANFATSVTPAARQPPASANLATSVAPAAWHPALANLTTSVAPSAPQPLALNTSVVSTAPAATRPLGPTAPAATKPSATVPPAVTSSARPTMPPPPPRELSTSTLWSVVVSRAHPKPLPQPPSTARDDTYLELHVSKSVFKNKYFPSDLRLPIKELASHVNAALHQLNGRRCRLHYALYSATQDRTPLSDRVVDDILHLRDLLEKACGTSAGGQWVRETLRDAAAKPRTGRADSSTSDSSVTTGQRRREDPSSGRGNAKRATVSGTSDSDSGQHPRRAGRDRLDRRQVPAPRTYAAPAPAHNKL